MAKFTEDDFNAGFEKIAEDCYDIRADMLKATGPSLEKEAQRGLGGPGIGGGPYAAGPGGACVCPKCGHKESRGAGVPCREKKCPKCGALMSREGYEKPKTAGVDFEKLAINWAKKSKELAAMEPAARAKVLPSREIPMKGTPAEVRDIRAIIEKGKKVSVKAEAGKDIIGAAAKRYEGGASKAMAPQVMQVLKKGRKFPWGKAAKGGLIGATAGGLAAGGGYLLGKKKAANFTLSNMMKIAQPYGQMARQAPRAPEPSAGFSVKHPTAVTTGAAIGGAGAGAGAGYGVGKGIEAITGASGAGQIGAGVGATLGAILGAAVGSREAEKAEEGYSHQLVNYLMKQGAEKPKSWVKRHPILTGAGAGAAALGTAATLLGGRRVGKLLKPALSSKTLSAADKAILKRQGHVATGILGGMGAGAGAGLGAAGGGIAHAVGKKEKTSAEKPKPKKPSKIQYIYGKTPESVRGLETSEAAGKRIGTGVGKMVARATAPVRAATWLPRQLLFPKELKEVRESGKTMAGAGGAVGGALGRLAGRLGGAKSESVPYVGPARTLALARAAGAKTMQKGLPSLPSVVESPTVVVKKK